MKDILGREVKDYDLVIGKGEFHGQENSPFLVNEIGIGLWLGKSMITKGLKRHNVCEIYLIQNPSELELKIKEEIVAELKERESKRSIKAKAKYISPNDLIEGGIYEDYNGIPFLYFGKCKAEFYLRNKFEWVLYKEQNGRCFCRVPNSVIESGSIEYFSPLNYYANEIAVLKTSKKLVKFIKKIDIPDEITFEAGSYCSFTSKKLVLLKE